MTSAGCARRKSRKCNGELSREAARHQSDTAFLNVQWSAATRRHIKKYSPSMHTVKPLAAFTGMNRDDASRTQHAAEFWVFSTCPKFVVRKGVTLCFVICFKLKVAVTAVLQGRHWNSPFGNDRAADSNADAQHVEKQCNPPQFVVRKRATLRSVRKIQPEGGRDGCPSPAPLQLDLSYRGVTGALLAGAFLQGWRGPPVRKIQRKGRRRRPCKKDPARRVPVTPLVGEPSRPPFGWSFLTKRKVTPFLTANSCRRVQP